MRVLFLHAPSDLYGASRSLLRLSSRLVREGHQVRVVLRDEGTLAEPLREAGVQVVIDASLAIVSKQVLTRWLDRILYPVRLSFSCLRLRSQINEFLPDLIHSNTALLPPGGIAAKVCGVPHILHVREIFPSRGAIWWIFQWYLYYTSDQILCVSEAVAQQFSQRIRDRKVKVLYNGIPAEEFLPVSEERILAFRKLYSLGQERLVGLVGRIKFGRKGQDVFLKAAALLHPKFQDVKFVCIGSPFPGNEQHATLFKVMVEQLGLDDVVLCTGDVEDIKAAYSALEISVAASTLPESFTGVVVESMAMAKPTVATAIGGTPEQIEDGRTGLLVRPGDECALAAAIGRLLENKELREELAQKGRMQFEKKFEFETFFHSLMPTYASLRKGGWN